jgi:drug/metabolite transporter (DMT)-like permease
MLIFICVFFMSFVELGRKKALIQEHAMQFVTTFYTFCFLISLVLIPKITTNLTGKEWLLIFVKSFILIIAILLSMKSLKHLEISKFAPLRNLSVIFVVLFSFLILGERLIIINYFGILLLIFGTYVVEVDHQRHTLLKPLTVLKNKYFIYVFLYLVLISLCTIFDKYITQSVDKYTYLFFSLMFSTIIAWAIQIIIYKGFKDVDKAVRLSGFWILLASASALIADIFYLTAVAMPTTYISMIIPLKRTSTLLSTFVGGTFFHEKQLLKKSIGCLIMVIGTGLLII